MRRPAKIVPMGLATPPVFHDGCMLLPPLGTFAALTEDHHRVVVATDEVGLRNPPGSLAGADWILLGDAVVLGDTTPEEQTIAARLRNRGFRVYNAGMLAAGTTQELRLLEMLVQSSRPRAVVVAFNRGNDFYDNYWQPRADPSGESHRTSPALAGLHRGARALCESSDVCQWARRALVGDLLRGRSRNPMGSVASAGFESFRLASGAQMREAIVKTESALAAIQALLEPRGVRLVLLGVPSRAEVSLSLAAVDGCWTDRRCLERALTLVAEPHSFDRPEGALAELARSRRIRYVSLLQRFREAGAPRVFGQVDEHLSAEGQALAADTIAAALGGSGDP